MDDVARQRLERFGQLVAGDPVLVPLDQAALALAGVLRASTDVDGALATLDELADDVPERTFEGLRRHLFDDVGLRGDEATYDDPANSFLDVVLQRRLGLPILLASVMIEVGRRANIGVIGIGMPMHFLVGDPRDPDALVDPFTGEALDRHGAQARFEMLAAGRLGWDDDYLDPVPARAIIVRMLANLSASYGRRRDLGRQAMVASMRWRIPELSSEAVFAPRVLAPFN